jgi:elongation factor Ts
MAEITAAMVKELREQTGAGMMDVKKALTEANGDKEEATKILRKKGLAAATKKAGRVTAEGLVVARIRGNQGVLVEINCETDFVAKTDQFKQFADQLAEMILKGKVPTVEELSNQTWPNDPEGHTVAQKVSSVIATIGENMSIRRFVKYDAPANAVLGSYIHANGKIGVLVELVAQSGQKNTGMEAVARDVSMHIAATEPRFVRREDVTQKDLDTEREIARDQAAKSGKPENIVEKIVSGKMEKFYGEACLLEQPYIKDDKQTVSGYLGQQAKQAGCTYTVTRFSRYKLGEGIGKGGNDFVAEVLSYQK